MSDHDPNATNVLADWLHIPGDDQAAEQLAQDVLTTLSAAGLVVVSQDRLSLTDRMMAALDQKNERLEAQVQAMDDTHDELAAEARAWERKANDLAAMEPVTLLGADRGYWIDETGVEHQTCDTTLYAIKPDPSST